MSTTVFVECVSCGRAQDLAEQNMSTPVACELAVEKGWTVVGYKGADATRCPTCIALGRRDRHAAEQGDIGWRSRPNPLLKPRMP